MTGDIETQDDCPNCNGHGRLFSIEDSDRAVDGAGDRYVSGDCDRCGGTGQVKA